MTPADRELLAQLRDGILWLTINRPEASNAIPHYVRDRLVEHFAAAHTDLSVRCVVLTGAGDRHFCTGADLRVPLPPAPRRPEGTPARVVGDAIETMRRGFQRLMETVQDCQKPVLVALNGTAAGGGAMLTLAADLVIAADTARLVDVFTSRGLIPDGGITYLLPRVVGLRRAKEMLFLGDPLTAAEAERLGLFNKVVPAAHLRAETETWASRLAARPTKVLGWAKKLLQDATEVPRTRLLEEEATLVELNIGTQDAAERVAALQERRDPQWKGW